MLPGSVLQVRFFPTLGVHISLLMRTYQQSTEEKRRELRTHELFTVANFTQRAPRETTPKYRKMRTWRPINNFPEIISPRIGIPEHSAKFYTREIYPLYGINPFISTACNDSTYRIFSKHIVDVSTVN